tara:strand:+ start:46 stop:228 length:183 start_codon:yes stop_codon:yes gene_type:complete
MTNLFFTIFIVLLFQIILSKYLIDKTNKRVSFNKDDTYYNYNESQNDIFEELDGNNNVFS